MTEQKKPEGTQQEPVTVEKLQELLDDGKITAAQAMAYMKDEGEKSAVEKALAKFEEKTKADKIKETHEGVIARYQKAIPALMEEDSDDFKKVAKTYKRLIGEGYSDGPGTERMALLETYGKISNVEKAKQPEKKPESFKDGGSGAGDDDKDDDKDDGDGAPASFSAREKEFWGKQIEAGQVKDWKTAADIVKRRGDAALRASMSDKSLRRTRRVA